MLTHLQQELDTLLATLGPTGFYPVGHGLNAVRSLVQRGSLFVHAEFLAEIPTIRIRII